MAPAGPAVAWTSPLRRNRQQLSCPKQTFNLAVFLLTALFVMAQRSKFPKVNFSISTSFATEAKPKDIKEGGSGSGSGTGTGSGSGSGVDKSAIEQAAAQLPKADLLTFWLSCLLALLACWPC